MAISLSNTARSAAADAIADLFDAGAGAGKISIYTGTQPASAEDGPSGTLLVTITLNDPAWGAAASGVALLNVATLPSGTAVATGTAGWFRALDSNDSTILDGSVSATGGGGDLELANISITSGQTVTITGGTLAMPAS